MRNGIQIMCEKLNRHVIRIRFWLQGVPVRPLVLFPHGDKQEALALGEIALARKAYFERDMLQPRRVTDAIK